MCYRGTPGVFDRSIRLDSMATVALRIQSKDNGIAAFNSHVPLIGKNFLYMVSTKQMVMIYEDDVRCKVEHIERLQDPEASFTCLESGTHSCDGTCLCSTETRDKALAEIFLISWHVQRSRHVLDFSS